MAKSANSSQRHIIKKQNINLRIINANPKKVKQIQEQVLHLYKYRLGEILERVFNRLVPADVHIILDKIDIDLGQITLFRSSNLAKEVERAFKNVAELAVKKALREQVSKRKKGTTEAKAEGRQRKLGKLALFEAWLRDGYYPSWAASGNLSVQELFRKLLKEDSAGLLRLIRKMRKNKNLVNRLVLQLSPKDLDLLIRKMYPQGQRRIAKQMQLIRQSLVRISKGKYATKTIRQKLYLASLGYLFGQDKKNPAQDKGFEQDILAEASRLLSSGASQETPAAQQEQASGNDLQVLEHFLLYGSLPTAAGQQSKMALQELFLRLLEDKLPALRRLIQEHAGKANVLERLLFQFEANQVLGLFEPLSQDKLGLLQSLTEETEQVFAGSGLRTSNENLRREILRFSLQYILLQEKNRWTAVNFVQALSIELSQRFGGSSGELLLSLDKNLQEKQELAPSLRRSLKALDSYIEAEKELKIQPIEKLQEELQSIRSQIEERREALKQRQEAREALQEELQKQGEAAEELFEEAWKALIERQGLLDEEQSKNFRKELRQLRRRLGHLQKQLEERPQELLEQLNKELRSEAEELRRDIEQMSSEELKEIEFLSKKTLRRKAKQARELLLQRLQDEFVRGRESKKQEREALLQEAQSSLSRYRLELESLEASQKQLLQALQEASPELKTELRKQLRKLRRAIREKEKESKELEKKAKELEELNSKESSEEEAEPSEKQAKLDFMLFVLQYGSIPWWAEDYRESSIRELYAEFLEKSPEQLRQALLRSDKHPSLWRRLVNQLDEELLEKTIKLLYKQQASFVFQQVAALERIQWAEVFPQLKKIPQSETRWSLVFEYLFQDKPQSSTALGLLRHLLIGLDNEFELPAEELMGYFENLSKSYPEEFGELGELLPTLREDGRIQQLFIERQKAEARKKGRQLDLQGLQLSTEARLEILQEYLETGRLAKSQEELAETIAQLADKAPKPTASLLQKALSTDLGKDYISKLPELAFWDTIQLLRPKALPLALKYYKELVRVLQSDGQSEKEELLDYLRVVPAPNFDIRSYLQQIMSRKAADQGRRTVAVLSDWKRRFLQLEEPKSSLPLIFMDMEIQGLKRRLSTIQQDEASYAAALEQIQELEQAYTQKTNALFAIVNRELIEEEGVPEIEASPAEVHALLREFQEALDKINSEIEAGGVNMLDLVNLKQQQIELQAQMAVFERKYPARLRRLQAQLQELQGEEQKRQQQIQNFEKQEQELLAELPQAQKQEPPSSDVEKRPSLKLWAQAVELRNTEQISQLKAWLDGLEQELQSASPEKKQALAELLKELQKQQEQLAQSEELSKVQSLLLKQAQKRVESLLASIGEEQKEAAAQQFFQELGQSLRKTLPEKLQGQLSEQEQEALDPRTARQLQSVRRLEHWSFLRDIEQSLEEAEKLLATLDSQEGIEQLEKLRARKSQLEEERKEFFLRRYLRRERRLQRLFKELQGEAQTELPKLLELRKQIEALLEEQEADYQDAQELLAAELPDWLQRKEAYLAFLKQQLQELSANSKREQEAREKLLKEQMAELEERVEQLLELAVPGSEEEELAEELREEEKQREKEEAKKPKPEPEKPLVETLFVRNAGIVLLWPYYSRLFAVMEYIEKNEFVSEEAQFRAAHILQYIVSKQTETPENEMVLNKILCAIPLSRPIPLSMDFSEDDLETADSLLQGAIGNWPKMSSMSPDALRGTFLNREGILSEESDRWRLKIEKGTFDMILKTVPWGFTFVKFPWMSKPLMVDWDY